MIAYYVIINCPKCGIEIPIEYGYSCGFDATIEMIVDTICRNKNCMENFKVDMSTNKNKTVNIDSNDFISINNNLIGIDSYDDYCEQLIKYIKNKEL